MTKRDELAHQSSCFNRADMGEMMFVLLARDAAAPATIMFWAEERIRLGKNQPQDEQILHAIACAGVMEVQRAEREKAKKLTGLP